MRTSESNGGEARRDTGRLEAFGDGVFAIAITLLVLDLLVPKVGDVPERTKLGTVLLQQWPVYLAYVISFITVLIMWANHHAIFKHIARTDHLLLLLNGLLLMGVTVVPFPTSLLAEFIGHHGATTAAAVHSGTFTVIGLLFNLLWRYAAYNGRLLDPQTDPRVVRRITQQYVWGPPLYFASFIPAFVNVTASLAIYILLVLFFALPGTAIRRRARVR